MLKIAGSLDSTLGNYLLLAKMTFGDQSPAANYLRQKIAESPEGFDEEVIQDERQMVLLLSQIHAQGAAPVIPKESSNDKEAD